MLEKEHCNYGKHNCIMPSGLFFLNDKSRNSLIMLDWLLTFD
jgi:hypothetical protein